MNEMQILSEEGHLSLTWNPDKPDEIDRARDEFNRLKKVGYAFFATPDEDSPEVAKFGKSGYPVKAGRLEARIGDSGLVMPEQVTEFKPKARRTVAVRPMRGG